MDPEPVTDQKNEKTECQATLPAADLGLPTRKVLQTSESGDQRVYPRYTKIGPLMNGDWTPGIQELDPDVRRPDPQGTRPQDPATPRRGKRTSWNSRLHGTQDLVGFGTSWDSRLHGTQDFVRSSTLRKTGTLHTSDQDLVSVVFSKRTQNFPDKNSNMDTTWYKVSR